MWIYVTIPFVLQAIAITLDEGYFHIRRGLPKWERIGHPLDTFSVLLCMGFIIFFPFTSENLKLFSFLAIFSCILVTKDEFIHAHHCPASEHWLHALLFTLHPITLFLMGLIWPVIQGYDSPLWLSNIMDNPQALKFTVHMQAFFMTIFFIYQIVYWNFIWKEKTAQVK